MGLLLPAFPSPPWVRNHDCSFSQVLQYYTQSKISTKLTNFTQSKPNNVFLVITFKSCVASQVPLKNSIQLLGIVSNKTKQPRQHPHMATFTSKNSYCKTLHVTSTVGNSAYSEKTLKIFLENTEQTSFVLRIEDGRNS